MKNIFFVLVLTAISFQYAQAQEATPKTYGLILSGGVGPSSNHYRYYENTKDVYAAFEKNGLAKSDIYTLYASGSAQEPDTRKSGVRDKDFTKGKSNITFNAATEFKKIGVNVNGSASIADFKKSVAAIAQKAKSGDLVSIFITDHGSSDGSIVLWGFHDKPEVNKTEKDRKIERENPGLVTQEAEKISVAQMREILKTIPPGVTVQIANNICYGGAMVELTNPDAGICVMSQVDDKRPSRSELDTAPFAEGYINSLGAKSFEEAYLAAKDADFFEENVGSMNSMDFFIDREIKKMPKKPLVKNNSKPICEPPKTELQNKAGLSLIAGSSEQESLRLRIEAANKKIKWLQGQKLNFDYGDYTIKRNKISVDSSKISKMQEGDEKDKATAAKNAEADALDYEKTRFEVRIANLQKMVQSYKNQISFLDKASPQQKEQYLKLKKCMERNI